MNGVNKAIILGNVGSKDVYDKVTNLSIATTDKWRDKQTNEAFRIAEHAQPGRPEMPSHTDAHRQA